MSIVKLLASLFSLIPVAGVATVIYQMARQPPSWGRGITCVLLGLFGGVIVAPVLSWDLVAAAYKSCPTPGLKTVVTHYPEWLTLMFVTVGAVVGAVVAAVCICVAWGARGALDAQPARRTGGKQ